MAAIYNIVWDAATPGQGDSGISSYQVAYSENGNWYTGSTGGTNFELRVGEGSQVHVEVHAIGNNGLGGSAAAIDFISAVNTPPPPPPEQYPPSAPGNLRADFVRFE